MSNNNKTPSDMPSMDSSDWTCPECGNTMMAGMEECPECGLEADMPNEAVLTTKTRKGLPDSSFLYIAPDGKRMFPVPDDAHIRNALSRIPQSKLPPDVKKRVLAKARALAKKHGIDVKDESLADSEKPELIIDSILTIPVITETIENGSPVRKGKLLISVADRENRNKRVYPESLWRREATRANEAARQGLLTGQAEHPAGRPELLNTIIKYTGLSYDPQTKHAYAEFVVIPTAKGKDFAEIASAGVAIGVSTRGNGSARKGYNGKPDVTVIQDDYQLEGIDVMLFGEQSVPTARLTQFESVEPSDSITQSEPHMPEKFESLAALREAYPELLQEAETPLAAVQASNAELTEKLSAKEAEAAQAKAAFETSLTEAKAEAEALTERSKQLEVQVKEAEEKHAALLHLFETARGKKHAAWLVFDFLKDSKSVAEVDERMESATRRAESFIENTLVSGQGVMVAKPEDDSATRDDDKKREEETPYPGVLSRATGVRIPVKR